MEYAMTENYPFSAPTVSKADPLDGLLQTSDLYQPIPVGILIWDGARPGYLVQLRLDGDLLDEPIVLDEQLPGNTLQLQLSHLLLSESRSYALSFQVTNHINGVVSQSPAITIKVDRTQPGASLLAPLIFPTATFSYQLKGLLPGYAGMQQGDVVQTLLNGSLGPTHTVTADELTLSPIEIVFTREHLQGHVPGMVSIEYTVTDRAGNTSITSLPTLVSVQL